MEIINALRLNGLYRYIFIGHGAGGGTVNSYGNAGADAVAADRYTLYGIASLTLKACGSADPNAFAGSGFNTYNFWEGNVATQGWFIGYRGSVNLINETITWRIARGRNRAY